MSNSVHPIGPASSKTGSYVKATLAIPEKAVRVIAALPETLTQRNVEAVTGVPPRVFLEAIRSPGFPLRVSRLGKLRVVNRAAFVEWLQKSGLGMEAMPPSVPANDTVAGRREDVPVAQDGTKDLLAAVGFREMPPARRARRRRER